MSQQVYLRFQPVGHFCNCQSSNNEIACPACFANGRNFERKRIIDLLAEAKAEELTPEEALLKGWRFDEISGIWWLPQEMLIKLINKTIE